MATYWLDEPLITYDPAGNAQPPMRFLLTDRASSDMEGIVYPDSRVWAPGDNSTDFTAAELRQIADLLDNLTNEGDTK